MPTTEHDVLDFTPDRRNAIELVPAKEPYSSADSRPEFVLLQDGPRVSNYEIPPPPKHPVGLSQRTTQLALKFARRLLNRPKAPDGPTDAERQARDAELVQRDIESFARGELGQSFVLGSDGKMVMKEEARAEQLSERKTGGQGWESVLGADGEKTVAEAMSSANAAPVLVLGKVSTAHTLRKRAATTDLAAENRKKCLSTVMEVRDSIVLDAGLPLASEKFPFAKEPATEVPGFDTGVLPVKYEDCLPVEQVVMNAKADWHADDGSEPNRMKRMLSLQSMRYEKRRAEELEARKAAAELKETLQASQKPAVRKRGLKKSLSVQLQRFASTTSLLRATREDTVATEPTAKKSAVFKKQSSKGVNAKAATPMVKKPCPPRPSRSPLGLRQSPSMRNLHYAEQRAAPAGIKVLVDPLTADHPSLRDDAFAESAPPPIPAKSPARAASSSNLILPTHNGAEPLRRASRDASMPVLTARQLPKAIVPAEKSQHILLASLNAVRTSAGRPPLVLMPSLGMRVQAFAAVEVPPLPPTKPATAGSHIGTQVIRDQVLSDSSQARATILVSPPGLAELAVSELWQSGKDSRHNSVPSNHRKKEEHRYTIVPTFEPNTDFDGYDLDDLVELEGTPVEVGKNDVALEEVLVMSEAEASVGASVSKTTAADLRRVQRLR